MSDKPTITFTKGGDGSGHRGHAGRPGKHGGSAPGAGGGGSSAPKESGKSGKSYGSMTERVDQARFETALPRNKGKYLSGETGAIHYAVQKALRGFGSNEKAKAAKGKNLTDSVGAPISTSEIQEALNLKQAHNLHDKAIYR